jgi:cytochrome oxidase Cu insertion factor (SCO1/SenC/PrrC family)
MSKMIFFLVLAMQAWLAQGQSTVWVGGTIDNLDKDSIQIRVLLDGVTLQMYTVKAAVVNREFGVRIPVDQPRLVSIMDGENYTNGIIEAGDSLHISYDVKDALKTLVVEGRGKEKFLLLQDLSHAKVNDLLNASVKKARAEKYPYDFLHQKVDSCETHFLSRLEVVKGQISQSAYQMLKGEIKGALLYKRYYSIELVHHEGITQTLQTRKAELTPKTEQYLRHALDVEGAYASSATYVQGVRSMWVEHYNNLLPGDRAKGSLIKKYQYFDSLLPASLRVPVLTLILTKDVDLGINAADFGALWKYLYTAPADSVYAQYVKNKYQQTLVFKKGTPAPDFTVENEQGKLVSLSTFKGKVVYLDFWFKACGACHDLFKSIHAAKVHFRGNDKVVFLSVSIDDKAVWKKALVSYNIGGYHVFTQNRGREHAMINDYLVDGYPTTYLIDPNGKMAVVEPAREAPALIKQIETVLQQ